MNAVNNSLKTFKPKVIPAINEWIAQEGSFTLEEKSRILVDASYYQELSITADIFREDVEKISGNKLEIASSNNPKAGDLYLTLRCKDEDLGHEGYILEVSEFITLKANTAKGVFYGTRTLLQMLLEEPSHKNLPRGTAKDFPKYRFRGFMIDVARKFFPLSFLKDYVRLLSYYKMNYFQIHFNDTNDEKDAHFRIKCDSYPELTAKEHYTKEEIRELQDYAKLYNIAIIPEIDAPGHARCYTMIKPELALKNSLMDLDINNPETYEFMDKIYDEFAPLFDESFFYIGADEYSGDMGENFNKYINRYNEKIKSHGKKTVVWTGFKTELKEQPNKDIIIDSWTGDEDPNLFIERGYDIINSSGGYTHIVPGGHYPDLKYLYESWQPNMWYKHNCPENSPNFLGAKLHNWNDNKAKGASIEEIDKLIKPALHIFAEKLWGSKTCESYEEFKEIAQNTLLDL